MAWARSIALVRFTSVGRATSMRFRNSASSLSSRLVWPFYHPVSTHLEAEGVGEGVVSEEHPAAFGSKPSGQIVAVSALACSRFVSSKYTPSRFAPLRFARNKTAALRSALLRFASLKDAEMRSARVITAPSRFAPLSFATVSRAPLRFTPWKAAREAQRAGPERPTLTCRCVAPGVGLESTTCGLTDHRNSSDVSAWTASGRGFRAACLAGMSVSVWLCEFCAMGVQRGWDRSPMIGLPVFRIINATSQPSRVRTRARISSMNSRWWRSAG